MKPLPNKRMRKQIVDNKEIEIPTQQPDKKYHNKIRPVEPTKTIFKSKYKENNF
jgi:hypothetical protein